jgi:hypothetical protein
MLNKVVQIFPSSGVLEAHSKIALKFKFKTIVTP